MSDTPADVNEFIHRRVMALEPERRFEMGISMLSTARQMVLSTLPDDLSPAQKSRMLYERMYGEKFPTLSGV